MTWWKWVLVLSVLLLLPGKDGAAQSLTGTTSLITIPTGELPEDGTFSFGGGFVNRKYSDYAEGRYHYTPYFFSVTFLPFLEVSLRFSRAISPHREALGDRMVSLRLQLLREQKKRPALVVGVHDFLRSTDNLTNNFNALYVAATKHVQPALLKRPVGLHLGYGTDWIEARHHQFVGLFGGISVSPFSFLEVLLEYDGEIVSIGQRVTLFEAVQLLAALQHFDTFAGGVSVHIEL